MPYDSRPSATDYQSRHRPDYLPKTVYLSSSSDRKHKQFNKREAIAKPLAALGVEILNRRGDERFSLTEVEEKVLARAEASIYLPAPSQIKAPDGKILHPTAQVIYQYLSEIVGRQTKDPNTRIRLEDGELVTKHLVVINSDNPEYPYQYQCFEPSRRMIESYFEKGTVKQRPEDICSFVTGPAQAVREVLRRPGKLVSSSAALADGHKDVELTPEEQEEKNQRSREKLRRYEHEAAKRARLDPAQDGLAVFCSASTEDEQLIALAERTGKLIAGEKYPLISGGGNRSMMQGVARGAHHAGGFNIGYNTMLIVGLEDVPEYVDVFYEARCIYTRMAGMIGAYDPKTMHGAIRTSDGAIPSVIYSAKGLILLPGGTGTIQEAVGGILEIERELPGTANPKMKFQLANGDWVNKPIITVNTPYTVKGHTEGFHEPYLDMIYRQGLGKHTAVVETPEQGLDYLDRYFKTGKYPTAHYEYVADRTSDTVARMQSEIMTALEQAPRKLREAFSR